MNKLTVVMQGPITQWTPGFVEQYKQFDFVKEVIVSTWKDEPLPKQLISNAPVLLNDKPNNPGMGNRNLQIVSSLAGCKASLTDWTVKVRTDVMLPKLKEMFSFVEENQTDLSQIFCLSLYPGYVFHPRDWVFFGRQRSLVKLFDIPLDENPKQPVEDEVLWPTQIRSETYIAGRYYGKENYFVEPRQWLMDVSPYRERVLSEYHELIRRRQFFIPFPQTEIFIPKHYVSGYPFAALKAYYGELYWDDLRSF